MSISLDPDPWFRVADAESSYAEKVEEYRFLADEYLDVEVYENFKVDHLPHLDEVLLDYIGSDEFDDLLIETVRATYPEAEQERFLAHFRGLLGAWITDQP
ncbi:MAG: hypothetical protein GEU79_18000 [Acidimicrobiia bacterium]|nr:hypothetical protein [Acidimicrobiia bacterium]